MIIIVTCPECGSDLVDEMICTNPPIPRKRCPVCEWTWEGQREQVIRVPFIEYENNSPYATLDSFQSNPCVNCGNNPKNGGSGNCNCVLGQSTIMC